MAHLLIVEDQSKDLLAAVQLARSIGFDLVDARHSVLEAERLLRRGLQGKVPLPDAIILDLDLGYESGFELIRFWRKSAIWTIPIVVWSVMAAKADLCRLFGVNAFVCKEDGLQALRLALEGILPAISS